MMTEMTEQQCQALLYDWKAWARPDQMEPLDNAIPGGWATWLVLAGRGWGKTKTGSETVRGWACGSTPLTGGRFRRIALVAETAADCRDVLVEGDSGILNCHPKDFRPMYEPSKRRLTWPNGAIATLYNATEPDQLRGPQHDAAWADELAKWAKARDTWDQLQFGLRLGSSPRSIITTTPRNIPVLTEILKDPSTVVTRGNTSDNLDNLAKQFVDRIYRKYSGTRLGRQELAAELLEDTPGALWLRTFFDPPEGSRFKGRINWNEVPNLSRVIVGVDPSGLRSGSEEGDSIGIVVAGLDTYDHGYLIADLTLRGSPREWGQRVCWAYDHFKADCVVAEENFGGAMVEDVIRNTNPRVAYRHVRASRGKIVRAEPVALLYEQGRVSHVNGANPFDEDREGLSPLEDQMCLMTSSGYTGEKSPDRVDAAVWALTELMVKEVEGYSLEDLRKAL